MPKSIEVKQPRHDGLAAIWAYTAVCECGERLVSYESVLRLAEPFTCEKCGRRYDLNGQPLPV
jgi:hypothetical protein